MSNGVVFGGELDSVHRIRQFPHPLYPKNTVPKIKGVFIDVPPTIGIYSAVISVDKDIEFVDASLGCSGYLHPDYWELEIDGYKIFESIYTKELPQTVYGGTLGVLVYPIKSNTPLRLDFANDSGTSKQVWFDIKFLLSPKDAADAVINVTMI